MKISSILKLVQAVRKRQRITIINPFGRERQIIPEIIKCCNSGGTGKKGICMHENKCETQMTVVMRKYKGRGTRVFCVTKII